MSEPKIVIEMSFVQIDENGDRTTLLQIAVPESTLPANIEKLKDGRYVISSIATA